MERRLCNSNKTRHKQQTSRNHHQCRAVLLHTTLYGLVSGIFTASQRVPFSLTGQLVAVESKSLHLSEACKLSGDGPCISVQQTMHSLCCYWCTGHGETCVMPPACLTSDPPTSWVKHEMMCTRHPLSPMYLLSFINRESSAHAIHESHLRSNCIRSPRQECRQCFVDSGDATQENQITYILEPAQHRLAVDRFRGELACVWRTGTNTLKSLVPTSQTSTSHESSH